MAYEKETLYRIHDLSDPTGLDLLVESIPVVLDDRSPEEMLRAWIRLYVMECVGEDTTKT